MNWALVAIVNQLVWIFRTVNHKITINDVSATSHFTSKSRTTRMYILENDRQNGSSKTVKLKPQIDRRIKIAIKQWRKKMTENKEDPRKSSDARNITTLHAWIHFNVCSFHFILYRITMIIINDEPNRTACVCVCVFAFASSVLFYFYAHDNRARLFSFSFRISGYFQSQFNSTPHNSTIICIIVVISFSLGIDLIVEVLNCCTV